MKLLLPQEKFLTVIFLDLSLPSPPQPLLKFVITLNGDVQQHQVDRQIHHRPELWD